MSDYWHKPWACPYFKWDTKKALACEAGSLTFPTVSTACAYYDRYCAAVPGWEECTLAKAVTEFYEKGDKVLEKYSKEDLELMVLDLKKQIDGLETELGRYKKKVNDQAKEIKYQQGRADDYAIAAGEHETLCNIVIASVVTGFGSLSEDGKTYTLSVPKFERSILEEYEVGTKVDYENGRYVFEAVKVPEPEDSNT